MLILAPCTNAKENDSYLGSSGSGDKKIQSFEAESDEIKELVKKVEDGDTIKDIDNPLKSMILMSAGSTGEISNVKYAENSKVVTLEDGRQVEEIGILAVSSLSETGQAKYSGLTQYVYLAYNKDGKYYQISQIKSWWSRTSSAFTVKKGYQYVSSQGPGRNGRPTSCSRDWDIGTPKWDGNTSATYSQNLISSCKYTLYDAVDDVSSIGGYTKGDVYKSGSKVFSNLYSRVTPSN